jgi:hypothetical protein
VVHLAAFSFASCNYSEVTMNEISYFVIRAQHYSRLALEAGDPKLKAAYEAVATEMLANLATANWNRHVFLIDGVAAGTYPLSALDPLLPLQPRHSPDGGGAIELPPQRDLDTARRRARNLAARPTAFYAIRPAS